MRGEVVLSNKAEESSMLTVIPDLDIQINDLETSEFVSEMLGDARISALTIALPWPVVLDILREYATRDQQRSYNFRFKPEPEAQARIQEFANARQQIRAVQGSLTLTVTEEEVRTRLRALGFTRDLKWFQIRDLRHLLSMQNGANFSVPGAGKTTVAFALHLLTAQANQHLLVVCPKAAFPAWGDVVKDCIDPAGPNHEPAAAGMRSSGCFPREDGVSSSTTIC
jgi:hypothetical protein